MGENKRSERSDMSMGWERRNDWVGGDSHDAKKEYLPRKGAS